MGNVIEFDNMQFTEQMWNALAIDELDPLLLNQYPFVYEGMTVGEYFREKEYYGANYSKVLSGEYIPLWKQCERSIVQ